jgi:LacI family transcriptional regulator
MKFYISRMEKKAVLKDIAKKVGVSTALVSYVLNNLEEEKRVGKEIAIKIREAALELNYTPNHLAKSLKTRKTNTIGFIVADIDYRYTSRVTKAVEAECQKLNLTVIYGSSGESSKKFSELVNVFVDKQVDGLILVPVAHCIKQIEYLTKQEVPFVLIDRILPHVNANIIAIDNTKAAYQATAHLIKTGHRRIGFISYKSTLINLMDRRKGFLTALADSGIAPDPMLIKEITDRPIHEEVKLAIDQLLALSHPCDSIFFSTDTLAFEGLRHINALRIPVPEKLGIVSFDESEVFELFYCPITHGSQPLEEIGRIAVTTLVDVMKHPKIRKQIFLETDFHIRKSCGEG